MSRPEFQTPANVLGVNKIRSGQIEVFKKDTPFVNLLEAAEQEFGFDQPGILAIPCEASELQRIPSLKRIGDKYWGLPNWLGARVLLKGVFLRAWLYWGVDAWGRWQGLVRTFKKVDT
ncbi:hypothetical protein LguiA_032304 [Lonicera macranthoides]